VRVEVILLETVVRYPSDFCLDRRREKWIMMAHNLMTAFVWFYRAKDVS
jgi:hypothetical protein